MHTHQQKTKKGRSMGGYYIYIYTHIHIYIYMFKKQFIIFVGGGVLHLRIVQAQSLEPSRPSF